MCKCTPTSRTPFCGKTGCEWPKQSRPEPQSFGAAFVVPEGHPAFDQIKDHESQMAMIALARELHTKFKATEIPSVLPNHKSYMYQLVVMTPEEYNKLKDYEHKYKGLQK